MNMKLARFLLSIVLVSMLCIGLLSGCKFIGRLLHSDLPFDIAADQSGFAIKSTAVSEEYPFCEFTKYEVTVYYVYVYLYDPDLPSWSQQTIMNLAPGEGIVVDLAKESLEDALGARLMIDNPAGNALQSLLIGFDPVRTVRGYLHNFDGAGNTARTTSTGFALDGGTPEDLQIPDTSDTSPAVDPAHFMGEPPINGNLYFADLSILFPGPYEPATDHLTIEPDDLFRFQLPIDMGVVQDIEGAIDGWKAIPLVQAVPFIGSSTRYYKYYLKRAGESHYTDMLRILTDLDGKVVPGHLTGRPFNQQNTASVFISGFKVDFDPRLKASFDQYNEMLTYNSDGTIDFSTVVDWATEVTCDGFDLLDSVGATASATFTVDGNVVVADYMRVE